MTLKPGTISGDALAIVRGHYVVRDKMATQIVNLKERIKELESEIKRLKEIYHGISLPSR
jgi:uncharacterized small protein (DUF1192 family)